MRSVIAVSLTSLLLVSAAVAATDVKIMQKGKKFSEKKITLSVGDSLTFINDDKVTHNIHSRTKDHTFDFGAQKPGDIVTRKFAKAGKVKVRCAIHPKMKMTVTVK